MKLSILCLIYCVSLIAGTLGSYNIRNFDYDQREHVSTNMSLLQKTILNMDADFISVQEIREKDKFNHFINNRFDKYQVILSECGGSHDQHLGFIYNKRKFKLLKFWEDMRVVNTYQSRNTSCRYGSRPLAIGKFLDHRTNKTFIAISVHLKSGGSPNSIDKRFRQLSALKDVVRELKRDGYKSFIIMGDFNSTEYNQKQYHYRKFKEIVRDMDLVDLSSDIGCSSYWWGGIQDGMNHPSLLDHILVSDDFYQAKSKVLSHCEKLRCDKTAEYSMGNTYEEVSDHCPQVAPIK